MHPHRHAAISRLEVIVGLAVFCVLFLFALPAFTGNLQDGKTTLIRSLNNTRQLYIATHQMALDRLHTTDTAIGWPGDIGGTFSNWATQLVRGSYLTTPDLAKLLSAPGITVPTNAIPTANNNAILVYAAQETSASNAVFLSTQNFTNSPTGGAYNPATPFHTIGFVVFQKGGSGSVLTVPQAGNTRIIGSYIPLCK